MKRRWIFPFLLTFSFLLSYGVPRTINYQGKLFESSGPVSGTKAVGYRLYKDMNDNHQWDDGTDSLVWEQIPANVSINNGLFSDTLDFSSGYVSGYDFGGVFGCGADLFLRVYVGDAGTYSDFTGTVALSPVENLRSAPYAFYAENAATVSNLEEGSSPNQTLRWDGTRWVASDALQNDGTDITATGDLRVAGNNIYGQIGGSGNLYIHSDHGVRIDLDDNSDGTATFGIRNGSDNLVFEVTEGGNVSADGNGDFNGNLTLSGASGRQLNFSGGAGDITSISGLDIIIDSDGDGTGSEFTVKKDGSTRLLSVPESGTPTVYPHGSGSGETGGIRFRELAANGSNYVGFRAPDALGSNYVYTLPATDGSVGQVLTTDGSGNLSWSSVNNDNIHDADNDTRVTTENSPDEDYIRFFTAGTERGNISSTGAFWLGGPTYITADLHIQSGGSDVMNVVASTGNMWNSGNYYTNGSIYLQTNGAGIYGRDGGGTDHLVFVPLKGDTTLINLPGNDLKFRDSGGNNVLQLTGGTDQLIWAWGSVVDANAGTDNLGSDLNYFNNLYLDSQIIWKGANDGVLQTASLSATRTWTLPDASGTIALTSDIPASDNYQYWTASDGASTTNITSTSTLTFSGTGGISTSLSGNTLTIDGSGIGDNDWTVSGSDMYSAVSGNVGIGTSSPGYKLDVTGSARATGVLYGNTRVVVNSKSISVPASTEKWLRIAVSSASARRQGGLFVARWSLSGQHGHIVFYAGADFGNEGGIALNIIAADHYGDMGIDSIRILENDTYDSMYIEIFADNNNSSSSMTIYVDQLYRGYDGWNLIDIVDGAIPTDYVAHTISTDASFAVNEDSKVFTVEKNGNVGVGTPSPAYDLDVSGDVHISGSLVDGSGSAGTSGQLLQSTGSGIQWVDASSINDGDWTISGSNMYSAVSGNVGIGTSSPSYKLVVQGQARVGTGADLTPDASGTGYLMFRGNAYTGFVSMDGSAMYVGHNSNIRRLDLMTDETTRLSITGSGNVGIGTTSPVSHLTVSSDGATELTITGNGTGYHNGAVVLKAYHTDANYRALGMYMYDNSGGTEWFIGRPYSGSDRFVINRQSNISNHQASTARLALLDTLSTLLTIRNDGKMGLGTLSPSAKLDIRDTTTSSGGKGLSISLTGSATWPNQDYGAYVDVSHSTNGKFYGGNFRAVSTVLDTGRNWGIYAFADSGGTNIAIEGRVDTSSTSHINAAVVGVVGDDINPGDLSGNYAGYFVGDVKIASGPTNPGLYFSTGSATRGIRLNASTNTLQYQNSGGSWVDFGVGGGTDNDWRRNSNYVYTYNTSDSVGIGTSSPKDKLHVAGKIRATGTIYSMSDSAGYAPATELKTWGLNKPCNDDGTDDSHDNLYIEFGDADEGKFYITDHWNHTRPVFIDAGNVGIGSFSGSNPSAKLHILGSSNPMFYVQQSATSGADAGIKIRGSRNGCTTCDVAYIDLSDFDDNEGSGADFVMARIAGGMNDASGTTGYIRFYTNSGSGLVEAMRIDKNGRVGIGTSSPEKRLEIKDGIVRIRNSGLNAAIELDGNTGATLRGWRITSVDDNPTGTVGNDTLYFTAFDDGSGNIHSSDNFNVLTMYYDLDANSGFAKFSSYSNSNLLYMNLATGKVGIGTDSPSEQLQVLDISGSSAIFLGGNGTSGPHGIVFDDDTPGAGVQLFWRTSPNQLILEKTSAGTGTNGTDAFLYDRDTDIFYFNGKVGIDTTAPAVALHIKGEVRGNQSGALRINTGNGYVDIGPKNSSWCHFYTDRARFYFDKPVVVNNGFIASYDENLQIRADYNNSATAYQLYLTTTGRVGVKTSSPEADFDVDGNTKVNSLIVGDPGTASGSDATLHSEEFSSGLGTFSNNSVCGSAGGWTVSSGIAMNADSVAAIPDDGGETARDVKELVGPSWVLNTGYANFKIKVYHRTTTSASGGLSYARGSGQIWYRYNTGSGWSSWQIVPNSAYISGAPGAGTITTCNSNYNRNYLSQSSFTESVISLDSLGLSAGDSIQVKLVFVCDLYADDPVPSGGDAMAKWEVSYVRLTGQSCTSASFEDGVIKAEGAVYSNLGSCTGDVAEFMPAVADVEPGDILSLNQDGLLEKASVPYGENVVGVYSSTPSVFINSPSEGIPVALTGRVYVKVTDENGPIHIGDMITSSGKPGYGMKADRSCYVIGRAMENLEGSEGKIMVMLQPGWYNPSPESPAAQLCSGDNTAFARQSKITIHDDRVTKNSHIFVTFRTDPGTRWWIPRIGDGYFVMEFSEPLRKNAVFFYLIENPDN